MEFAGTQTEAEMLQGTPVFGTGDEKLGEVDQILFDKATGMPEWLALKTGLLGRKSRLVPLDVVERRGDGFFVPYSASQVEEAPEPDGDEVSQELERRLASHYGRAYSESRSPTGLARGTRGGSAQQKAGHRGSTRSRRSQTTRSRRTSDRPTREELYNEAKRLGIEGRSKMNKAQLERAVARSQGTSSRQGKASPFEVQKFLEAVGYPASKRELIREAKEQGADSRVRSTLERLPDEEFESPADVSRAISSVR